MSATGSAERIYLDYNATAPLRPEARDAMCAALEAPANPSSVHAEGRRARTMLEAARASVADLVGARPDGVVFTSGATEAARLALTRGLAADGRGVDRLILSAVEHVAVLRGHRFPSEAVSLLPVTRSGIIDLDRLRDLLAGGGCAAVAIQAANNETGVIQPVAEAAALVRAAGGLVICDAAQGAGRIDCRAIGADIVLLSAHKLGGLAGAGALVLTSDRVALGTHDPRGGGQERGFRPGTENVPAIAAFGAAARAAGAAEAARMRGFRDAFERQLRAVAPDVVVFGAAATRLPNTCAFAVPGVAAERLLMALDLAGVALSSGSACASGVVGRSHVLEAMGITPDLRGGALRASFGWASAEGDAARVAEAVGIALDRMRRRALAAAA